MTVERELEIAFQAARLFASKGCMATALASDCPGLEQVERGTATGAGDLLVAVFNLGVTPACLSCSVMFMVTQL